MAFLEDEPRVASVDDPPGVSDDMLRLEGTVEHIIYTNEENGYTVFDFGIEATNELITAQGITP